MLGCVAWILAAGLLYGPVLLKLGRDWQTNPTYSHGFVVPLVALFLLWRQRHEWRNTPTAPSAGGLLLLLAGLGLFVAGTLGAELFITRISLIGVLAGTIAYALGWNHLRLAAVPLAFLVFMIPLPSIVFDHAALSLQLVASRLGEQVLRTADVPVLRDGNLLTLANAQLEVNEACSGIRSMVALLMMTALTGYLFEPTAWRRILLGGAAVPLALALNGVRIAVTGLATSIYGPGAAADAVHTVSGWLVFAAALLCVWGVHLMMMRTVGDRVPATLEVA
jgi:exosortase